MHHPALHSIYFKFDFSQDLNAGLLKHCLKCMVVCEEIHYKIFTLKLHPSKVAI